MLWHSRTVAFSVLFVCTGNLCRSPIGERLFQARAGQNALVVATSAGTAAVEGYAMDGPSAIALRELGGDPDGHVARRLSSSMIAGADLILTAETQHRSTVVQTDPVSFRRTFTFREFGRLGSHAELSVDQPMTVDALVERVAEVAAQRGNAEPAAAGADDIDDPFGASLKVARGCAAEVADAVDAVIDTLGLRRGAGPV